MKNLKLGLIGLDTSHVLALAAAFNNPGGDYAIPGARIVCAFPGGSLDFELSISRQPGYTAKLRDEYGIEMVNSPREVAQRVDAVLHTSVDGRIHLSQFRDFADLRKPTFLDKPFAVATRDAHEIAALAERYGTPLFSSSSLRFAHTLQDALANNSAGGIVGADFSGPMARQDTQPGYFWYGIHTVEMLYTTLGVGCLGVRAVTSDNHDLLIGRWADGRLGVARGNQTGGNAFTGVIHRAKGDQWIDATVGQAPHHRLALAINAFFRGAPPPVPLAETVEIIRFIEAANESRELSGLEVTL